MVQKRIELSFITCTNSFKIANIQFLILVYYRILFSVDNLLKSLHLTYTNLCLVYKIQSKTFLQFMK